MKPATTTDYLLAYVPFYNHKIFGFQNIFKFLMIIIIWDSGVLKIYILVGQYDNNTLTIPSLNATLDNINRNELYSCLNDFKVWNEKIKNIEYIE